MRVSCESSRSARDDVVTSTRVQSVGVGLPTDASVARRAVRFGTFSVTGLARSPDMRPSDA
eukprot:5576213-Pyramimonas_sp.AAC.1